MTESLAAAEARFLAPANLTEGHLAIQLGAMLRGDIDFADLYFQHAEQQAFVLEDGRVRDASFSIDHGVGLRAVAGAKTGFAYANGIDGASLKAAANAASAIADGRGATGQAVVFKAAVGAPALYAGDNALASVSDEAKTARLRALDALARTLDTRVSQVSASLVGRQETVMVLASDGTRCADERPLVRFSVSVVVEQNGRRERGSAGGGGRISFAELLEGDRLEDWVREAVRIALVNLDAVDAPAGSMPVVLGPGWPGVLLHEAVGHGLEGDFNRRGTSTFSNRVGEAVASPLCTVVDQGNLPQRRGSLTVDDEGTATGETVLIENGVLRGYLQDKTNARLMNVAPTGNGRRESYAHLPMPRMTNTFLRAGQDDPEEILRSVQRGLYAVNFGGGSVDITSGKFVFSTTEAYLIEEGRITAPVKGATLIGQGPEVMNRITAVGHDLALDSGVGVCGKDGQSVPVGVGQPTLKVSSMTVGGTGA
ncbi:MAG: metalloprotease TldD [Pseudomonadales bacterium]